MSNKEAKEFILSGGRLSKPNNCIDKIFELMQSCWSEDPLSRPDWHIIYGALQVLLPEESKLFYKANSSVSEKEEKKNTTTSSTSSGGGYYYQEELAAELSEGSNTKDQEKKGVYMNDEK